MEATRLHFQLGTTYDAPIDVLGIAQKMGLVLMMQPLDNLLGFYVRRPGAAGIVINSRIPESLQRFTLAHEIGHHVLGHQGTADDQQAVDRFDPNSVEEVQAQAFAAALLMPLPMINGALRDLPATKLAREIRDTDAYLFSRQLGVSYAAGVWALYRRDLLTLAKARELAKRGPQSAKATVSGGAPIGNARADVWLLTEENDDLTILCRVGDEIHVQLNEDTSSGFVWAIKDPEVADLYHPATAHNALSWDGGDELTEIAPPPMPGEDSAGQSLDVIQDEYLGEPEDEEDLLALASQRDRSFPSRAGIREVTFVPSAEGPAHVRMELVRAWDRDSAASTYDLDLRVRSRQLAGTGLFAPQAEDWVDEHAVTA